MAKLVQAKQCSTAAPSQGIGGGNSAGTSASLSRADHDHTIRETGDPANLTVGAIADGQFLKRSSGAIVGATHVHRIGHTYAIAGEIKVPSGDTDFICPFFVSFAAGQTAKLVKARHAINSGTSVTCKIQNNGSDVAGFTGISVTTTPTDIDPADVTLANNDKLALVVTGVSDTPKNLSFTLFIEVAQ